MGAACFFFFFFFLPGPGAALRSLEPQIGAVHYEPGDRFLLCSDGVIDGYWDHALADLLKDGATASHLVHGAIAEGSRDNATALVIDVLPGE